jgi:HAD superfamily phosphatase (TIGR01668 family)
LIGPNVYLRRVQDIDLSDLRARRIDTLLIDLDNTLLPRDTSALSPEVIAWVASLPEQGFTAVLVSNNWHQRVHAVAEELGLDLVAKAVKPLPFAFLGALSRAGARRENAAVIGDQLFTDVLGGRLLGMFTVLVTPLSESDLWHTLALRHLERAILRNRVPQPEPERSSVR